MERPKIKDPEVLKYIEHLEQELQKFKRSPYLSSYLTLLGQINDWNDQLDVSSGKGKIDLFADKESKEFDRCFKYFGDMLQWLKQLDDIRKLMTPEEQRAADEKIRNEKMGIAEKLALGAK